MQQFQECVGKGRNWWKIVDDGVTWTAFRGCTIRSRVFGRYGKFSGIADLIRCACATNQKGVAVKKVLQLSFFLHGGAWRTIQPCFVRSTAHPLQGTVLYGTFLYLDIMNPVQLESSNTCRTFCVFSDLEIGRAELNKADRRPQNPFHEESMWLYLGT